jgi:serine acetyltransferase
MNLREPSSGKEQQLGANATIICGVEIGPYAMIGAEQWSQKMFQLIQ